VCTVSWVHQESGYQLFCNRDEKLSRPVALSPRLRTREGVRFVSPIDAAAGGTWIGVNEFGISICLLNGAPQTDSRPRTSRGLLIPRLISAGSRLDVMERMQGVDLETFAPFTIVVLDAAKGTSVVTWDGQSTREMSRGDVCMPLISSSFDPDGVANARRQEFLKRRIAEGAANERLLTGFHSSHGERKGAYSTCMHRADAETVSFSQIRVTESEIEFAYSPGAPCQVPIRELHTLARIPCNSF